MEEKKFQPFPRLRSQHNYVINSNEVKYVEKYKLTVLFRHKQKWQDNLKFKPEDLLMAIKKISRGKCLVLKVLKIWFQWQLGWTLQSFLSPYYDHLSWRQQPWPGRSAHSKMSKQSDVLANNFFSETEAGQEKLVLISFLRCLLAYRLQLQTHMVENKEKLLSKFIQITFRVLKIYRVCIIHLIWSSAISIAYIFVKKAEAVFADSYFTPDISHI